MAYLLLVLSIVLSVGRNMLSKDLSSIKFKTRQFFLCQGVLFLCGGVALVLFGDISFGALSPTTLVYAIVYGILLVLAQWFYTASLAKGNTALCSTVYSLGFVLPTLSGAVLWHERFSAFDFVGILCAVSAVSVSGAKPRANKKSEKSYYFIPLVVAMLSSGGLGIVQKLQQKSAYAEQKSLFLLIAFAFASVASFAFFSFTKSRQNTAFKSAKLVTASLVGLFFGCCNLLNTTLAGKLDSAIFFPTLNIGVILLSMLSGMLFFGEKIKQREIAVLLLGGASILLLNLA